MITELKCKFLVTNINNNFQLEKLLLLNDNNN